MAEATDGAEKQSCMAGGDVRFKLLVQPQRAAKVTLTERSNTGSELFLDPNALASAQAGLPGAGP